MGNYISFYTVSGYISMLIAYFYLDSEYAIALYVAAFVFFVVDIIDKLKKGKK